MDVLQGEAAVVRFVGPFVLNGVFGKGAFEVFPVEFSVDPELVFCVSPCIGNFTNFEGVFVFHLNGDAPKLFGKAGPFNFGESERFRVVIGVFGFIQDFSDEIDGAASLHCVLSLGCA